MTSFHLAVQSCLLAVLLGYVVLLPLFEEPVCGRVRDCRGIHVVLLGRCISVAVFLVELLEDLAARLCPMLAFCMILGSFLYSIAILHQSGVLRFRFFRTQ